MRIKEIGIQGFKSFVDRTVLQLGHGISCIVGPNGCGKSNVIDAIKWSLGEQSARQLRGQAMADLIFAGTERRPQVGMAEVTLTLTTDEEPFPGPWAPLSELQVTRRLYRSGESEYLINQLPCRLRDINDLFMDTGVGGRASYAIIEQGRVERLVSARPDERRKIIEEAAGISRFKARREEALAKLEQTQANLLRVGDIVAELKKQVGSLERQAKKAEEYLQLREFIRRGELLLALLKLDELVIKLGESESRVATREHALEVAQSEVSRGEQEVEALRNRLGEEGRRLGGLRDTLTRSEGDQKVREGAVGLFERELHGLTERIAAFELDSRRHERRMKEIHQGLKEAEKARTEATDHLEQAEAWRQQEEDKLGELNRSRKLLMDQLEAGKRQVVERMTEIARIHNHLSNLSHREAELRSRAERNMAEQDRLGSRMVEVESRVDEATYVWETARGTRDTTELQLSDEQQELLRLQDDIRAAESRGVALRETLGEKRNRMRSLQELEMSFEGFGAGLRAVLMQRSRGESGVLGTIADFLDIPREYEVAVEAVLGERLQWVVVEDKGAGVGNVQWLRRRNVGRGSFVPATLEPQLTGLRVHGPGLIGPLLSHIRWDNRHASLAAALLADVFLVDELNHAVALWEAAGGRGIFVTLQGDVIDNLGVVHGGGASGGLLRKKGEIRELTEETRILQKRLDDQVRELEGLRLRRDVLTQSLERLREQLHRQELDAVKLERDLRTVREELERLAQQKKMLSLDGRQLQAQVEELSRDLATSRTRSEELEQDREGREREVSRLSREMATALEDQERSQETLTQLRIRAAEHRGKQEEAEREIRRRQREMEDLELAVQRRGQDIDHARKEVTRIEGERARAREELTRLGELIERLQAEIRESSRGYGEARGALGEQEEQLARSRRGLTELGRLLQECTVERAELRLAVGHLVEGVTERHQLDLRALAAEVSRPGTLHKPVLTSEGEANTLPLVDLVEESQALRPRLAELMALEAGLRLKQVENLENETDVARKRISRLGDVNLAAVHEYREVFDRYTFTASQEEDLRTSVDDIKKTIVRINRTTRERFREAFDAINAQFEVIFPKIFEGGTARLILTDAENLLETGVDIAVQPPGKKVQNVNLLSGGEKAMTAVALIFAVFMVRPSPFCILDEVDAPLDEANSHRFHEVVRELAELSQFIVITHNKRTMEVADTLYGVTMEEPGVSRLVTVDLS